VNETAFKQRCVSTPPAVVAGVMDMVGLGIVRDLGTVGVPVLAVSNWPRESALLSRYCATAPCHDPRYDLEAFLDDMRRIGEGLPRRAVVIPAFEDYVWALSENAHRLDDVFDLPFARWNVMSRIADKEAQFRAARDAGVDVPTSFFLSGDDDLRDAADAVPFPALLKPKTRHQEMRRLLGRKVLLVPRAEELQSAYETACICGPLILQEIIPGDDDSFYTYGAYHDASSRPLGRFVSRKVRQHPRLWGESRIAESFWEEDVAAASESLLQEISYHGVSGTEFKRDPRDGRLKLMEVNARNWLHSPLARLAGVNLSQLAYADAIGAPFVAAPQVDGVRWTDLAHDVPDSVSEMVHGNLNPIAWLGSFRDVRVDCLLSVQDPLPGVVEMSRKVGRRLRRGLDKVGGSSAVDS
jgi:predicted ATP-grasp superfamily ATP-dependent carboligase